VIRIELKLGRLRFGKSPHQVSNSPIPGTMLNDATLLFRLPTRSADRFLPGTRARNWSRTDVGGLFLAGGSCGMKRKLVETRAILTDALRSFAVAVAIVLLGHFMIWLVAEGVMLPDAFGGTPTPFQDQAEAP
jgi:hypothetical protein